MCRESNDSSALAPGVAESSYWTAGRVVEIKAIPSHTDTIAQVTGNLHQNEYDVAIVGAGPAGCAAAFTAATKDLRVCLIDKSELPRDKLCGGLVTERSKEVFE